MMSYVREICRGNQRICQVVFLAIFVKGKVQTVTQITVKYLQSVY